ncbi:hypothetical protein RFI_07122 [Reticulomyxa filosa]|uniref:Uncharacterized protein n=1 Tax=Reticulomyxa filosa TaxID=46433 RepID=X6NVZ8_RETFI|nr:hypothetical protein RFI_07122 [Reticulomyxa filosa]|eukprot:ETO29999.1 hypothetical protein RFI_07122 [Reticulomyxa filosa]
MVKEFEDCFVNLLRLEVAWFTYNSKNPLGWLESVLVSEYSSLAELDFSNSDLTSTKLRGLLDALHKRNAYSPITVINFTGNRKLNDDIAEDLCTCIAKKLPSLKTLYLDHTNIGDGTCKAIFHLFQNCSFFNDRKSFSHLFDPNLMKEGTTRLKKISMEGTKITKAGVDILNEVFSQGLVHRRDAIKFYVHKFTNTQSSPANTISDDNTLDKTFYDKRIVFY